MNTEINARPTRVLHIGKFFAPHSGGMETYLQDLITVQNRLGLKAIALVHNAQISLTDKVERVQAPDGTKFKIIRAARWFNVGFVPISPLFFISVWRAIKIFQPDVLHIHHPNSSAAWLLLNPYAQRVPWVAHWHADVITTKTGLLVQIAYQLYRIFENRLLRRANRIVATSPPYLENSKVLEEFRSKCCVIPLGLDPLRLPVISDITRRKRPLGPLILFVGRLVDYKGLFDLADAVSRLQNLTCWIAGDGPLRQNLQKEAERLGIAKRFVFFGNVSDPEKWQLYKTCDALVLPSNQKTEAFGMVSLEAAHFERPIVVTDIPGSGTKWVAQQLPNSFIAKMDNPEDLAEKILMALNIPRGMRAHQKAGSLLDLHRHVRELEACYRDCLL